MCIINRKFIIAICRSNFYIKGAIGYLYAERELNEICKIYGYGKGANTSKTFSYVTGDLVEGTTTGTITGSGARSINVDDINQIAGVTPSTELNSDYGTSNSYSIYYPTTKTTTGLTASTTSRTYTTTTYYYEGSTYLSETIYKMLFRNIADSRNISYWLASRSIDVAYDINEFNVRKVEDNEVSHNYIILTEDRGYSEYDRNEGVRPVVYLKSTVQTSGKNASGAWNIID